MGKTYFSIRAALRGRPARCGKYRPRVDVAQRTEQPFFAELAVVQLHKVHHAFQNRCPERIRLALPCCHDQPHRFTVERFAHLLVEPESRTNAADAVIGQLLAVIIETQPTRLVAARKALEGASPPTTLARSLMPAVSGAERPFCSAKSRLPAPRSCPCTPCRESADSAAVTEDAPLDGVLPIRYDELTVAETDLRLICHAIR